MGEAKKKRAPEMEQLKLKKKAEKAGRKNKVGFSTPADNDGGDDNGGKRNKKKNRKGKTDKMLDEMGDAHKYLAKLRKNRKNNKSKANLLGRKKSMFFKDRKQMMLDPVEIAKL